MAEKLAEGGVGLSETRDYHLMFTDISEQALEVVRYTVRDRGLWRASKEEGFQLLREMFSKISGVYGFPAPSLIESGHEHYLIPMERIGLPKVSLVSALHEYRHHMQKYHRKRYEDIEVDARAWSVSTFYLALPEDFNKAWRNGRIWYMPPYTGG